ncbi:MAG: hypothetical protein ACLQDI_07620 [Syntrophobacteraceae bacterium]
MSKVREIRESFDKKLGHWEASSTEFEMQLQNTTEQAPARIEIRKRILNEALEKFKSEVAKAKGISEERKKEMEEYFDDVEVQLALVKADDRDAFKVQRKMIKYSIATLEDTVNRRLSAAGHAADKPLQEASDKFIAAAIEYEAEADALEAQIFMNKAEAARFERNNSDLPGQIN